LLVLGDAAEDEFVFKNTVAPENTSYKYFHALGEFVKYLMEDGDPEDGGPAVDLKLSSAALADSLAKKLAKANKEEKKELKEAGRHFMCKYRNEVKKSDCLLKIIEEQPKKLEEL
jgi:hypothetical protein